MFRCDPLVVAALRRHLLEESSSSAFLSSSQAILRSSNPLRKVLSSKAFVGEFGEPKPYPAEKRAPSKKKGKGKGKTTSDDEDESEEQPKPAAYRPRRSVFGGDDALKIAPKLAGVTKDHKDIEFLKLRSVAVIK